MRRRVRVWQPINSSTEVGRLQQAERGSHACAGKTAAQSGLRRSKDFKILQMRAAFFAKNSWTKSLCAVKN
jgi:hypothetical protein